MSDAQLPDYIGKEAAANGEAAPLMGADASVAVAAAVPAAAKPVGVFSDMGSSGVVKCVMLDQQAIMDAKDTLQAM